MCRIFKKKYFVIIKVNCNNHLQLLKKNVESEDYGLCVVAEGRCWKLF